MNNEAADATEKEDEPWEPIKDKHTLVDEIVAGCIKLGLTAYVCAVLWYCMCNFVGKDKGVDPNLVWGFVSGILITIVGVHFHQNMKNNPEKPKKEV